MTDLHLHGIEKTYGSVQALKPTRIHIRSGELFSLLGPSGCGKTTLLRIVAGFVTPTTGRLKMDDDDVTDLPPHKRNVGMVFQDYALFPDRSVFDNVCFGLQARKLSKEEQRDKASAILAKMGLSQHSDRAPGQLSGGQRQRVAMARALVISPRVLLLDEPLSALDAKLRVELREVIRSTQQDFGITTLFVTHDQEEALSVSDRIALMHGGSIVQMDTPLELYDFPANVFAADFLGGANLITVQHLSAVGDRELEYQLAGQKRRSTPTADVSDHTKHAWKLCIRPESWAPEEGGLEVGKLKGRVRSSEFLGGQVLYLIELDDGGFVRSLVLRKKGQRAISAGATVSLAVPNDAQLVRDEGTS